MINGQPAVTLILDTKNTPSMTKDHQTLTVDGEEREYYRLSITDLDENGNVITNPDGTPKKTTKYYYVGSKDAILTATNVQRSHLDFTKTVTGKDAANAPADSLFTYEATITTPTGTDYWFSIWDGSGYVLNDDENTYIINATKEVKSVNALDATHVPGGVKVDEENKKIS